MTLPQWMFLLLTCRQYLSPLFKDAWANQDMLSPMAEQQAKKKRSKLVGAILPMTISTSKTENVELNVYVYAKNNKNIDDKEVSLSEPNG